MKRLLSTEDLDTLISLVGEHMPDSELLSYLEHSRYNKWGVEFWYNDATPTTLDENKDGLKQNTQGNAN